MQYDLKLIKKYYGENMAHLCRSLFPTLLEKEGQLISLLESKFAHSKFLYDDIVYEGLEEEFQSFIYSLMEEPCEPIETNKSVRKLLDEAGYVFYECKSEEDIQKFKKFYEEGEELCTFNGGRLKTCFVFFAVKKNIFDIKRDENPRRQDEYGTSVISIQFTRGANNTLSIKNRYNHTVKNPDATFKNNLENITPGLTRAFEKEYGLHINQNSEEFKLEGYFPFGDGKFYAYDYEINNIYYGPNNIIIDNFEVNEKYLDKSRYIVIGPMILDMQEKSLSFYDKSIFLNETLPNYIGNIETITVNNLDDGNKRISLVNDKLEETILILSPKNRIIGYINNSIRVIDDRYFLFLSFWIKYFEARSLEKIGYGFLNGGADVEEFIAPNLKEVGDAFLSFNNALYNFDCPKLEKVGNNFLGRKDTLKLENEEVKSLVKSIRCSNICNLV